jgi:hypothetical protein
MAQIVPAEIADPGSLEGPFPRRLKSGGDIKDTRSSSGLFAPVPQYAHGFVIERHMPGLAILGILALDGDNRRLKWRTDHSAPVAIVSTPQGFRRYGRTPTR